MNFEFLKGLNALEKLYKPCKDAEELAISYPYMSMIASRKSAELLAKLIYIAAHYFAAEELSFVDILRDEKVQQFISNRNVMRAFHHIRKSGNEAVHGEDLNFGKDQAIDLLEELHYIAGETATRLHLIHSYPVFDAKLKENPNATFVYDEQIGKQAQQLFLEYVREHNYQEYAKHFVEFDWSNKAHRDFYMHGVVDMHEFLEFKHRPNYQSTLEYLQQYLIFLDDMASERSSPDPHTSPEDCVRGSITICIDGNIIYKGNCEGCTGNNILGKLTEAQSFSFDCYMFGNLRAIHDLPGSNCEKDAINEDELWQGRGLSDFLESIRRREQFIYKMILYYPDDDNQVIVDYIRNGKTIDVPLICKADFPHKLSSHDWYCDMRAMYIDFDRLAYSDILEKLHDAVSKFLPEDELPYVQELWEDEEEDPCWLLSGNCISSKDLSEIVAFIDRFNTIVEPVAHECTVYFNDQLHEVNLMKQDIDTLNSLRATYVKSLIENEATIDPAIPDLCHCFYCMEEFAVAAFIWKDHKLQLVGTVL